MNAFKPRLSGLCCCPFEGGGSVVVDSLFYVPSIVCEGSVVDLCCVMHYCMSCLVFQSHWRGRERERAGCFALNVFLVACDCYCSAALSHYALGWSAVCYCGIF